MNRTHTLRINPSHALIVLGMVVALFAVMFRPGGATADSPVRADVFSTHKADGTPAQVDIGSLTKITQTWSVIPSGKKYGQQVDSKLTGVPLADILREGGADISGVNFARVRLNVDNNSRLALVPLGSPSDERPPIVLFSGKVGSRSLGTPSLVPGQPDNRPIYQNNIVGFSKSKPYIEVIPAQQNAQLLSVKVTKEKKKTGQYNVTAKVTKRDGGKVNGVAYEWFQTDANGKQTRLGTGSTVTTTATGTKNVVVNVVATQTSTGSMGIGSTSYIPKSDGNGNTKPPASGGGNGNNTNQGTGGGTNTGTGTGTSPGITTTPSPSYTPPSNPSTTTPPSTYTPPVDQTPVTVDSTAITNVAQNFSGTGGLTAVSGVLLSSPTAAPAGGGGAPISALPAPVADQLNSIFKPVEGADDVWPYLIALLFAFSISGAVREWVKP
jgi:hypothetical protein